jgi:hypothetical protein
MASRKQQENVEYFKYVGILTTNDAKYTREIISRFAMAKATSNKKKTFHQQIGLRFVKKPINCYSWSIALCGAENWTLRKVDQKYLESFEMWCWRRIQKISWTDHVRN